MANQIIKLPQEVINQIAAGEVIERPASVVKELVDNAIDAKASLIKIKILGGGIKLIEVSDNGIGIDKDMLPLAFEANTTSKVNSIEDLNTLLTMGFRGEALSTIVAVSDLEVLSRSESSDEAYLLQYKGGTFAPISSGARDVGTTITVKSLFNNIPARLKYMKSVETEYRKILEILLPYFILHSDIHFIVEKEGSVAYNLPAIDQFDPYKTPNQKGINHSRVKQIVKSEVGEQMIELFYDGAGMKVSGFVAHPSAHQKRAKHTYVFINGRPIIDRGLYRSVITGFDRFIPHGEQIPFVINVSLDPSLVDMNVHPRKEEVRFINPYRVYSAVEEAVSSALSNKIKENYAPSYQVIGSSSSNNDIAFNRLRSSEYSNSGYTRAQPNQVQISNMQFEQPTFLLDNFDDQTEGGVSIEEQIKNGFQVFKKYLIIEFQNDLWVVDQHAAAERITFEKLLKQYDANNIDIQNMLVPSVISMDEDEILYITENVKFFEKLGFKLKINPQNIEILSLPVQFINADLEGVFTSVFQLSEDSKDLEHNFENAKQSIIATIACHNSIRTNQALSKEECISLVVQLQQCDNPYSCPHGRPIVWKLNISQIDSQFDRTY